MAGDILTPEEIEYAVSKVKGTWVKRRNARNRLTGQSNAEVRRQIDIYKGKIRSLRAKSCKECVLREWYAEVTKLELKLL